MSIAGRLVAFAVALAALFSGGVALGGSVDTNRGHDLARADGEGGDARAAMSGMPTGGSAEPPPGLSVADGEFRLVAGATTFAPGRRAPFTFRIVDAHGVTVRDFDAEHTKRLHLIVVRRDLTGYQHVHPVEMADGSWSVPLRFDAPGVYRVYADFRAHGAEKTTLGTDVFVPGDFRPQSLPAAAEHARGDGYDVLMHGAPPAGQEGLVSFIVTRHGAPVTPEPYLGADGHLIALREGDLAYLHVHPQETRGSGGPIRFMTEYPSAGRYRLFLQFRDNGAVHTVAFTREVR